MTPTPYDNYMLAWLKDSAAREVTEKRPLGRNRYTWALDTITKLQKMIDEPELRPGMTVAEAEKILIRKTLIHTGQNRTNAASMLGISVRGLRLKIRRMGLE